MLVLSSARNPFLVGCSSFQTWDGRKVSSVSAWELDLIIILFSLLFLSSLSFNSQSYLTELYSRASIQNARLISNPGCYATNTQSLIAPLLPYLDFSNPPTVFGISGYSGAGTKAGAPKSGSGPAPTVPKISAEDLQGGVKAYALTDHIHEKESSRHLSKSFGIEYGNDEDRLKVAFIPNVAPWFQGIISTVSAPLNQKMTAKDLKQLYQKFYEGEKLVKIGNEVPEVKVSFPLPLKWGRST